MNETVISKRQQHIINLLLIRSYGRADIATWFRKTYPISKITLIRDLNDLIEKEWILVTGTGRAVKYQLNEKNRMFLPISLGDYFSEKSNIRQFAGESFKETVFKRLYKLFSAGEMQSLSEKLNKLSQKKAVLDPNIYQKEIERITIDFAWKSSRIEGNTYTLLETEQLIINKKEAEGRNKEEAIMILNHKDALNYVLNNSGIFRNLSIEIILKIHSILIKDLGVSENIRSQPVAITGTNYLPPKNNKLLNEYLSELLEVINNEIYPVSKALIAVCLISYLQPFIDGNKRTGRILANSILIANDIIPISFRNVDELEYKKALILFYEQNIISAFKRIFTDQLIFSNSNYFRI
ncbi:hypothetical protein A2W14_03730 [Candidatus Gottesmanbacteria bacterium RBG_16_37_8]|uniref:Fido domain-containing protein n=1 Tax=Candidatus Gottesmanbacteria bacterium RBG_16_37_8 TaxID=1798371 RepID=A0A1F5YNC7_9BACT|nr:MAG: hypothetical protein A2W14_03730 [Candidatus Gottesmanbacteria bacterium RBG_16_37_8]